MNKKELKPGTSVFQRIEADNGDIYFMEGVVTECRVVEHPDPEDRYFPRYVEVDIQWFAGAPADIVASYGFCQEQDPDGLETDIDELARKHIEWVTNQVRNRLAERAAAKADGRIAVYPKQPKEEW